MITKIRRIIKRKWRFITCVCLTLLGLLYVQMDIDPVLKQSIHSYLFRHEIIRRNVLIEKSSRNTFCREHLPFAGDMCPKLYTELSSCDFGENGFSCPDIRLKGSTTLRQAQLALTRMLRVFDLIARKNNMPYWIRAGTLLGAIRHNGFVPWDDKIDIAIPMMYYVDFFRILNRDLPGDMFFQTSVTDAYYDDLPSNKTALSGKIIALYRHVGGLRPKVRDRSSCYKFCFQSGCKRHDGLQLDIFVSDAIPWGIFPLREMTFEGFNVLVPSNWESVISEEKPEFWELPRYEDRIPKNRNLDPTHSCEELAMNN